MNMQTLFNKIDEYSEKILECERYIWKNPETGYKEYKTSEYMKERFAELGYDIICGEDITGFYTVIDTGREGPEVLVLGELDSVICPTHPEADKVSGAVHACGHNAQCAALLGVAAALRAEGALDGLSGRIRLCAVPAEELIEIEYRMKLKEEGKIKFFGGKSEFLSRGYFDGVDIALMVHTSSKYFVEKGMVGCLAKKIIYKGLAAHAGGSPWLGKNALYAATSGINAANALRETFRENDLIRFHPIITSGGDMVNAIPERVTIESYVRGKSFEAIVDANKRINRALTGAALSLGNNIEIIDMPGYSPLFNDDKLIGLAEEAFGTLGIDEKLDVSYGKFSSGSTDMGDISCIMPVVHGWAKGAVGKGHGNDYMIEDPINACINSAKWQLAMLSLLLKDGAVRAKEIIDGFEPRFKSKEEFLSFVDSLNNSGDRIEYTDFGATVRLD